MPGLVGVRSALFVVHSKPGVKEGAQDERDTYMRFLPGHSGVGPLDGLGHRYLEIRKRGGKLERKFQRRKQQMEWYRKDKEAVAEALRRGERPDLATTMASGPLDELVALHRELGIFAVLEEPECPMRCCSGRWPRCRLWRPPP